MKGKLAFYISFTEEEQEICSWFRFFEEKHREQYKGTNLNVNITVRTVKTTPLSILEILL
jgi:hypothetical protein